MDVNLYRHLLMFATDAGQLYAGDTDNMDDTITWNLGIICHYFGL